MAGERPYDPGAHRGLVRPQSCVRLERSARIPPNPAATADHGRKVEVRVRLLKSFGRFWYEFIIGDDWKIAAAVVIALGLTFLVMRTTSLSDHVLAVLGGGLRLLLAFAVSLAIDVRSRHQS